MKVNPDFCHDFIIENADLKDTFKKEKDFTCWKQQIKNSFMEVMKIADMNKNIVNNDIIVEYDKIENGYRVIRYILETEKENYVPCHLLIPNTGKDKYQTVITLTGHDNDHIYNANGIMKKPELYEYSPYGELAIECVKKGYAVLCVEMRGMGELHRPSREGRALVRCGFASFQAMLLGRVLAGERAWDVTRAIDSLKNFPIVENDNVKIIGHSSGAGNTAYYSACLDDRIKTIVSSSGVCTYKDGILNSFECLCNYIPDVYNRFEMGDLAGLLTEKTLKIVAYTNDDKLPFNGVKNAFDRILEIYTVSGNSDKCQLITIEGERKLDAKMLADLLEK